MSDDFLRDAGRAWRSQPDVTAMRLSLHRRRWTAHAVLALEMIGCAVGFGVGLVYFAIAVKTHQLLFILSAVAMLAGMPLTMVATVRARRSSLRWEDQTPRAVVVTGLRRAEAALRMIRVGRWGVVALGGFVALLWVAQAVGVLGAARFMVFYTTVTTAICAPYWLYLGYRDRRATRERLACVRLLEELDEADSGTE
jgi:hypothetical protein